MNLPTSVTSWREPVQIGQSAPVMSAAVGAALLAHAAAMAVLLMLRPPQPFASPPEPFEVSIVVEDDRRPNNLARMPPGDRPIGGSPLPGPNRPEVSAATLPWNRPADAGPSFDMPGLSNSGSHAPSPAFDQLGAILDCLAAEGAARRLHHSRRPCAFASLPFRAPGTMFPTNAGEPAVRAGDDYRNFETIRPLFDQSLLPDKPPPANRAFENWLSGLFR